MRFTPGNRFTGRQKGTPNKATADVKRLAGKYGPDAIERGRRGKRKASKRASRLSKSSSVQPVSGEDGGPTVLQVITGVAR